MLLVLLFGVPMTTLIVVVETFTCSSPAAVLYNMESRDYPLKTAHVTHSVPRSTDHSISCGIVNFGSNDFRYSIKGGYIEVLTSVEGR